MTDKAGVGSPRAAGRSLPTVLRRDRYVLEVGLNEDTGHDARTELVASAARLDARLTDLLAGVAPE